MDDDLIDLLKQALLYPAKRYQLLQQKDKLRETLNDLCARRWLYEQALLGQSGDRGQKVRSRQVRQLIIQIMQNSGCIWKGGGVSPDVYDEALARTWEWFNRNFCEYDPERSSFTTWFNVRLQWTIREIFREIQIYQDRCDQTSDRDEAKTDPLEQIPDKNIGYDRYHQILKEWIEWVNCDPGLRNCRMQNYPHVNGQSLVLAILNRLLRVIQIDWGPLAQELNVEQKALSRFWQNTCRRRFRQLLRENGY